MDIRGWVVGLVVAVALTGCGPSPSATTTTRPIPSRTPASPASSPTTGPRGLLTLHSRRETARAGAHRPGTVVPQADLSSWDGRVGLTGCGELTGATYPTRRRADGRWVVTGPLLHRPAAQGPDAVGDIVSGRGLTVVWGESVVVGRTGATTWRRTYFPSGVHDVRITRDRLVASGFTESLRRTGERYDTDRYVSADRGRTWHLVGAGRPEPIGPRVQHEAVRHCL